MFLPVYNTLSSDRASYRILIFGIYLTCSYEPSSLVLSEVIWDGLSRIHIGLWHILRNDLQAAQLGGWGGWRSLVQRGREKETKWGVSVWRRHPKGNESRRNGVKTLSLAQLELEEDEPMAGRVSKGSKGWIWWNLLSGPQLKLSGSVQHQ